MGLSIRAKHGDMYAFDVVLYRSVSVPLFIAYLSCETFELHLVLLKIS